jgi:hypothetical protein
MYEGGEFLVGRRADVERDFMVELADGDLMELFACQAKVLQVCWTDDLR